MQVVKGEAVASYDPSKKYTWTPEDQFTLSGAEFGLVLNTLRAILNTPEAAKILLANQANEVVESTLAKAVESGVVKEVTEDGQK
jgi:hypothetical protein